MFRGNISLWDQINIMVCDVNLPRLAEQHPKSLKRMTSTSLDKAVMFFAARAAAFL